MVCTVKLLEFEFVNSVGCKLKFKIGLISFIWNKKEIFN